MCIRDRGLGIYLLQIPLPALITQPLELLAGVNTPLSMLITGIDVYKRQPVMLCRKSCKACSPLQPSGCCSG